MRRNRTPILAVLLAAALGAAGCGGGDGGETAAGDAPVRPAGAFPRENLSLLLISLDTCRPDRLGCYGYEEIDTPRIDELAAAGVRFERVLAAAPITLPSHASLFTGNYPYRHRVRNNATYRLPEGALTLAERMKREGYGTAAFVASYPMDSRFGLDQGFDRYDDRLPVEREEDPLYAEIRAEEAAERAIAWLEEREEEEAPFFLFLHFFDPHWRYRPPEPFASLYPGRPYDGEIAYLDGEVGRVLDALDRLDIAGRTVVILTGDHGEGLGEHGEATHAVFLYDSTIRVPLLVRTPDREAFRSAGWTPGRRVERMVRGVDIAPTALDLLGLPPLPEIEGISLAPLLADPASFPPLVHYAETFAPREDYGWSEARAIVTEGWKYVLLPREELYDLAADPREERNRIDEERDRADRLRALLEERIAEDRERAGGEERRTLGAEERARFEALGYVARDAEEEAASGAALPDPKDRISLLDDLYGAFHHLDRGEGEAALAGLERVLEKDPANAQAAKAKGDAYALMEEWAAAESLYRALIPRRPNDLFLRASRGYALIRLGRAEEALEAYRDLLARDPEYPEGNVRLGECRLLLGEWDEAEAAFRRELAIRPESAEGYGGLGKVHRLRGEREEAIRAFQKAIELRPDFGPAYRNLGNLYEETGEWERVVRYYKKGIEVDPDMVETYYNLALVAKRMNRRDAAAELLGRAVERNPRFAKGYFGLGNLLREEGRHAQAIVQYEIALRYDPEDPDVHLNLGVAHAALGMLDEAIRDWEAAVEAAPRSPSAETARRNIEGARTGRGGTR